MLCQDHHTCLDCSLHMQSLFTEMQVPQLRLCMAAAAAAAATARAAAGLKQVWLASLAILQATLQNCGTKHTLILIHSSRQRHSVPSTTNAIIMASIAVTSDLRRALLPLLGPAAQLESVLGLTTPADPYPQLSTLTLNLMAFLAEILRGLIPCQPLSNCKVCDLCLVTRSQSD